MAKQKRKPAKGKPITSNPLFPAVVALWFGALFGLGSLAVRPSLIEDLVLSSRLDLVIPAAAPPLGVTARIMVAMLLAAIGALIGGVMARRLTRPKVEVKERSRGARDLAGSKPQPHASDTHPDAPTCTPISMRELGESLGPQSGESAQPGRRRSLTLDHVEDEFVPHDSAPLPGGTPQIHDFTQRSPAMPAPRAPAPQDGTTPALAQPPQPDVAISPDSIAAHADGRQVFGMEQAQPAVEQPRQIFGAAIAGDHVSPDFVREAGYTTTVFETEVPPPLFDRRSEPAQHGMSGTVPAAQPEPAVAATITAPVQAPVVHDPAPFAAAPEPAAPALPVQAFQPGLDEKPASDPLPSPATLGMTDLASRLAESMRRRRAARAASAVAAPEMAVSAPAAPVADAATPAPFAAPPEAALQPRVVPQQGEQFAAPAPALETPAMPVSFEPAPSFAAPSANAVPGGFQMPAAAPEAPPLAAAPSELPSALRPLALDAFLEDDTALDPGVLPPRHIAMPAAMPPAAPADQPLAFEDPRSAEPEAPAEETVPEENYASLLGIAQPRGGFVRIEEPEGDASNPEPVVIFPGQAAFAAPAPQQAAPAEAAGFRRFDSPAAAGAGQPVVPDAQAPAVDSTAADQALRSALANLQRMSGAA